MALVISEISVDTLSDVDQVDSSFVIDSRLVLAYEQGEISYTIEKVPPFTKRYPSEQNDYRQFIASPDRTVFLAYLDDIMAGQVVLRKHWNHFVFIDWIVVDAGCRGQGIGRALMDKAVSWAKEKNCPGLALETQDNNVAACRFYAAYGFKPGGFDCLLYHNFPEVANETAITWYLIF